MGRIEGQNLDPENPYWENTAIATRWPNIYSSPDGEDWQSKMLYSSLYGAYVGTAYSAVEMASRKVKPNTLQKIMFAYIPTVGTVVTMCAAYSSVVCIAAHVTKSDGPLNHFVGGLVAGSIYGARRRNPLGGIGMGLLLGLTAGAWKFKEQHGLKILPPVRTRIFSNAINHWEREFTLTGIRKRQTEMTDSLNRK